MANGTASLKEAIKMFGPEYTTGQRKGILASVGQSAVSSGLSGTTRPGAVSSGMLADLETTRRTKLAGLMSQLAQMESQERMEAERLSLSKAALALEQSKVQQTMKLQRAEAKKPGGALSKLPAAPQGYMWEGGTRALMGTRRLSSMFSPTRSGFQRF